MKLNRLWYFCLLPMFWLGCVSHRPKVEPKPCVVDELRRGDQVTITYSDTPIMIPEQKTEVKEDGSLTLHMGTNVLAAGKKIRVVEKEIVAIFVPRWYKQLSVTVKSEMRWYSVGGEVKQPGRQNYIGKTTVIRAIQSCGDFTDFANRRKVQIHRMDGQTEVVDWKKAVKDPKLDLEICPGDSIIVPSRW
jgi:protein involved in polysaccharide export with SLBB domain